MSPYTESRENGFYRLWVYTRSVHGLSFRAWLRNYLEHTHHGLVNVSLDRDLARYESREDGQ